MRWTAHRQGGQLTVDTAIGLALVVIAIFEIVGIVRLVGANMGLKG